MTTENITGQEREQRRSALAEQLQRAYLGGLWQSRKRLDPLVSHKWGWKDIWACLSEAGEIVDVDENSPMRTIQLVNPSLEEMKATSRTIQVSVQLLKTGELAQAHRHTQPPTPFHRGSGRRLHDGGRRTDLHARPRLHRYPRMGLARSHEPLPKPGNLARHPRSPPRRPCGSHVQRTVRGERGPADNQA